ncbi:hypothetical protein [Enterovibrio norvegicus]|uniref:hypothetical protein n=1 Tax=Enterovibrio norvegicus TaxID=188144 RepID=UPI000C842CB4|nr:hypothetical protein [Enterovibrio norvegicus]PML78144.1 hypothetical protein BCT69_16585 [Enterovibrio norvegicus]
MAMSAIERREKTDKRRKRSGLKTVRLYMTKLDKTALVSLANEVGFSKPSAEDLSSVVCELVRRELGTKHDIYLNHDSIYLTRLRDIVLHRRKLKVLRKNTSASIAKFLDSAGYSLPAQLEEYGIENWNDEAVDLLACASWFEDNLLAEPNFEEFE